MELLIFSDAHGSADGMRRALSRQLRAPDAVCFLGDGVLDAADMEREGRCVWHCVRGNCDWGALGAGFAEERVLELAGHRLLLTHGHRYFVKEGLSRLLSHAASIDADIVLFGHTHEPTERVIPAGTVVDGVALSRPVYLFNPGSIGMRAGSFGTLLLSKDTVLLSHGSVY